MKAADRDKQLTPPNLQLQDQIGFIATNKLLLNIQVDLTATIVHSLSIKYAVDGFRDLNQQSGSTQNAVEGFFISV